MIFIDTLSLRASRAIFALSVAICRFIVLLSWPVMRLYKGVTKLLVLLCKYSIVKSMETGSFIKAKEDEIIVTNDKQVGATCARNLSTLLPKLFTQGWSDGKEPDFWSSTMGFTSHQMPLVGNLSSSVTQGQGQSELVAAGFNG